MGIVFHHPVNRIARQSVLAAQRGNTAVFHLAQPAVSCNPERAVRIDVETVDMSIAQPFDACIGCADVSILEIDDATLTKSKP